MPGAENLLNKGGLYLDDLTRKLRLLHPDVHQLSQEITTECAEYGELAEGCGSVAERLVGNLRVLAEGATKEQLAVVGKRSRLLQESTEGSRAVTHLKATLAERKDHLERLNQQHEALLRVNQELEDTLFWLSKK